uniref:Uncharacterized protein n=1 Tax=Romanomermis culicivorax TaxID=13658 RepID=A0A915JPP5_ROMCU
MQARTLKDKIMIEKIDKKILRIYFFSLSKALTSMPASNINLAILIAALSSSNEDLDDMTCKAFRPEFLSITNKFKSIGRGKIRYAPIIGSHG